jgi:hypothetical protein
MSWPYPATIALLIVFSMNLMSIPKTETEEDAVGTNDTSEPATLTLGTNPREKPEDLFPFTVG